MKGFIISPAEECVCEDVRTEQEVRHAQAPSPSSTGGFDFGRKELRQQDLLAAHAPRVCSPSRCC